MLKKNYFLILLMFFVFSCKQKEQKKTDPIVNPDKDSEMTLLMREMYIDMEEMKVSLEKKENLKSYLAKHQAILKAKLTDPKVKNTQFDQMALGYLESLDQMEFGPYELKVSKYKILHSYCVACHEKYVPGPIEKINNLQIN